MITEQDYDKLAPPELKRLLSALDEIDSDDIEAELESDILTLEFADGAKYVANSHRAARQIWLAAEHSAWHFDWSAESSRWVSQKTNDELWSTLERLVSTKLKSEVHLKR